MDLETKVSEKVLFIANYQSDSGENDYFIERSDISKARSEIEKKLADAGVKFTSLSVRQANEEEKKKYTKLRKDGIPLDFCL